MTPGLRHLLAAPVVARLARRHVAGPTVEDAIAVITRSADAGGAWTIGSWCPPDATASELAAAYAESVEAFAASGVLGYVSIKLGPLAAEAATLDSLVTCARARHVRLHFDSLRVDSADETLAEARTLFESGHQVGVTLPGRWARSVADAGWLAERGIPVRVVKGQWPDPSDRWRDPRIGFLQVIDVLRGSAGPVAVATHDASVAAPALSRLVGSGTACSLEQLYGLPDIADELHLPDCVGHTVYVPYGAAYLPYALSQALRRPRILGWVVRDLAWHRRDTAPDGSARGRRRVEGADSALGHDVR